MAIIVALHGMVALIAIMLIVSGCSGKRALIRSAILFSSGCILLAADAWMFLNILEALKR